MNEFQRGNFGVDCQNVLGRNTEMTRNANDTIFPAPTTLRQQDNLVVRGDESDVQDSILAQGSVQDDLVDSFKNLNLSEIMENPDDEHYKDGEAADSDTTWHLVSKADASEEVTTRSHLSVV